MVCEKGRNKMWTEMQRVVQFLDKNYRKHGNNHELLGRNKNKINYSKKDNNHDEVGMLRGVMLADMHKSE